LQATLAGAAAGLVCLAGTSYAAASRDDGLAGAPTVGTCTTLTPDQAAKPADRSTVVDCSKAHTAQVAGVVRLPRTLTWATATARDLYRVVVARCEPDVDATLGRDTPTRDSSAYDFVWFEPTKAERAAGARWLSCSVVRPRGAALATLPTTTTPFLPSGALPDPVARCLTKAASSTPCAARHLWRASGTFHVAGRYPGRKVLDRKAARACASRVSTAAYRWTYRDRTGWNVGGDHTVVCYSKTRG
jgi:hypothetical protein